MKHQILDEETIKLAEKLLIASYGAEWAAGHPADKLTAYALEQAESFWDAVASQETKTEASSGSTERKSVYERLGIQAYYPKNP